VDEVRFIK